MQDDQQLIEACKKHEQYAQKVLYETYAPIMRSLCSRYCANYNESEDLLHEGFIKIFTNIKQYSGKGSFEGWMKRIFINLSITYFHNMKKKHNHLNIEEMNELPINTFQPEIQDGTAPTGVKELILNTEFTKEEIQQAVLLLPTGYRMVFNLYVFEDFSHKEISKSLNINENTSKSQLARARKQLQKILYESALQKLKNENQNKFNSGNNFLKLVI